MIRMQYLSYIGTNWIEICEEKRELAYEVMGPVESKQASCLARGDPKRSRG